MVCEETDGHEGSPERLAQSRQLLFEVNACRRLSYLMLVTSQSRAIAALHMRLPRKPLPPQTTSFFFAAAAMFGSVHSNVGSKQRSFSPKLCNTRQSLSSVTSKLHTPQSRLNFQRTPISIGYFVATSDN